MSRSRLVYLAGLDGSGKSTQAERFIETTQQRRWVYRWTRWEPKLTAPLMSLGRRILGRGTGRGSERPSDDSGYAGFTAGKQKIFRRRWMRSLWATLVLLEFLPQAWWRLASPLWKGRWILCDRYLPDVWVDLATNFDEGTDGVRRLAHHPLCRLFPPIEQVVYLDVSPRIGYERKMDGTPLAYLEDRRPLYLSLEELLPFRRIDADRSMIEVADELRRVLEESPSDSSPEDVVE